jgi:hypothetical protein
MRRRIGVAGFPWPDRQVMDGLDLPGDRKAGVQDLGEAYVQVDQGAIVDRDLARGAEKSECLALI